MGRSPIIVLPFSVCCKHFPIGTNNKILFILLVDWTKFHNKDGGSLELSFQSASTIGEAKYLCPLYCAHMVLVNQESHWILVLYPKLSIEIIKYQKILQQTIMYRSWSGWKFAVSRKQILLALLSEVKIIRAIKQSKSTKYFILFPEVSGLPNIRVLK